MRDALFTAGVFQLRQDQDRQIQTVLNCADQGGGDPMGEPLYLTDAERHLRPADLQDRYRFVAVFRLRNVQYVRWFPSERSRDAYLAELPAVQIMNTGVAPLAEEVERRASLLKAVNR